MKKVISIAISTLFISNFALAETKTIDNNLLQSIQQKIDAKKSGLGADIQTNSGLSGLSNKSINKDMNEIAKNVNVSNNTSATVNESIGSNHKMDIMITKPYLTEKKSEINNVDNVKKNYIHKDNGDYPKKKIIHKRLIKKNIVKKIIPNKIVEENSIEMVKTQSYIPNDFSEKNQWIKSNQIKSSIKNNGSHLEISISDINGKIIPKEQFNKDFIRVVQLSQDFKIVNNQENKMDFLNNSYIFNKEVDNCAAIFVQYHLKYSSIPTTFIKYLSNEGILSDSIDSSCKQTIPNDLSTNINYSETNNISGILFKNNKFVSSKPVTFNIVFSRQGIVKIPNNLFVYAVKFDFSDLSVLEVKNYGHNSNGVLFEQMLEKGNYVLGYSFNEGETENYFKNINVQ